MEVKNEKVLQLIHVKKEFELKDKKHLKAVNDVTLDIEDGECVGIVGESGCGKSTLAKLITCMESVSDGQILFQGQDITNLKGKELRAYRRQAQMIFQDPASVFSPRMKIGTFVMEPWKNFEKKNKKEAMEMGYYALQRVGLPDHYFHKYPHELSGGELQRVAIARAIALHPKLLICDEATSALDVSIQKDIIDLLQEHREESPFSILFICHDLALVENFCDKVAVMYLGKIVEIMEVKALRKNARHPYSKALLDSVFYVYDDPSKELHILPGEPPSAVNLPKGCAFCERCKYATEKCRESQPELRMVEDGHWVACHCEF